MAEKPKLTIVGAGLVGCLAAQYMHEYGFNVTIYEYRDDIRKQTANDGQSINLALSSRGLRAMQVIGIDTDSILQIAVPMKGRMVHSNDGNSCQALLYDVKYEKCIYSVGRNDLIKFLMTEAEKISKIHFRHKITNVDLKQRKLRIFKLADNVESEEEFDYLIGCDGAYSIIRQFFLKTPLFNYSQTYIDHGYMELKIPPNASDEKMLSTKYLHVWPRSTFMLIALPNYDKSWTVTLFMSFELFDSLKEPDDLIEFFKKNFADVLHLIGKHSLITTFFKSKPQPLISVKCSRFHVDSRCLLLGDAAHAVVPFYGQGMNAGLEDCLILYQTLKKFGYESGFEEFSKIRIPDTHAISDLSMGNYPEMRNLVTNKVFLLQKKVSDIIYTFIPNLWKPLYICVTFTDRPYAVCMMLDKLQKKILLGLTLLFILVMVFIFSSFFSIL